MRQEKSAQSLDLAKLVNSIHRVPSQASNAGLRNVLYFFTASFIFLLKIGILARFS